MTTADRPLAITPLPPEVVTATLTWDWPSGYWHLRLGEREHGSEAFSATTYEGLTADEVVDVLRATLVN